MYFTHLASIWSAAQTSATKIIFQYLYTLFSSSISSSGWYKVGDHRHPLHGSFMTWKTQVVLWAVCQCLPERVEAVLGRGGPRGQFAIVSLAVGERFLRGLAFYK